MRWFKKLVASWARQGSDYEEEKCTVGRDTVTCSRDTEATVCDADPILNFRVFSAIGGRVVEFRTYDRVKDRTNTTTYIIHKDDDFGDKIAKIATLESMK
jgi:hypothetical protein